MRISLTTNRHDGKSITHTSHTLLLGIPCQIPSIFLSITISSHFFSLFFPSEKKTNTESLESLQKSSTDSVGTLTRKEDEIRTLESTVYDLRGQVSSLRTQLLRSQEQPSYSDTAYLRNSSELADLKQKVFALEQQIEQHKRERNSAQTENERLRQKVLTLEQALHQTETESDRLRAQLSSIEQKFERTQSDLLRQQAQLNNAQAASAIAAAAVVAREQQQLLPTSASTSTNDLRGVEEERLRGLLQEQQTRNKALSEDYDNRIFQLEEECSQVRIPCQTTSLEFQSKIAQCFSKSIRGFTLKSVAAKVRPLVSHFFMDETAPIH